MWFVQDMWGEGRAWFFFPSIKKKNQYSLILQRISLKVRLNWRREGDHFIAALNSFW